VASLASQSFVSFVAPAPPRPRDPHVGRQRIIRRPQHTPLRIGLARGLRLREAPECAGLTISRATQSFDVRHARWSLFRQTVKGSAPAAE
jgi:hypothetical protein